MRLIARSLVGLMICLVGGCEKSAPTSSAPSNQQTQTTPTNPATGDPVIVVRYDPGMPADTMSRPEAGIRLAVWTDGTVLHGEKPSAMFVGTVETSLVEVVLNDLESVGFFSHSPMNAFPPDSQSVRVIARKNGVLRIHGAMTWEQSDPSWWPNVGKAITRIEPVISRPVAEVAVDGTFRGYDIHEWFQTPWQRE